jgi:hypothetical protein
MDAVVAVLNRSRKAVVIDLDHGRRVAARSPTYGRFNYDGAKEFAVLNCREFSRNWHDMSLLPSLIGERGLTVSAGGKA